MEPGRRLAAVSIAVTMAVAVLSGCSNSGHRNAPPAAAGRAQAAAPATARQAPVSSTTVPSTSTTGAGAAVAAGSGTVPAVSLVGTIRAAGALGSQTPGARSTGEVPGQWLGAASVLPVLARQPGWVEVGLAQRPNESTAWVPAADVTLALDPYHIIINLSTTHLQLFNHGQLVADFPVGIGVPSAPTPTGHFFVALFARPPSPGYGQFVIVTSAHSNTITDWEESGDAIVAIHGSLGSDAAIGTTGAAVSHGCIRLHDADLLQLRDVPAGTPIDIVS